MIKNPFVTEVVRIIKKQRPYSKKHAIILVSQRFFKEATQTMEDLYNAQEPAIQEFLDVFDKNRNKNNPMCICHTPIYPVTWLSDYEFEIRLPCKL